MLSQQDDARWRWSAAPQCGVEPIAPIAPCGGPRLLPDRNRGSYWCATHAETMFGRLVGWLVYTYHTVVATVQGLRKWWCATGVPKHVFVRRHRTPPDTPPPPLAEGEQDITALPSK